MLFNSLEFLVFFLVVHQVFWRLPAGLHKYWLLVASLFFYAFWNFSFLFHFLGVLALTWIFLLLLQKNHNKILLASIIILLLLNLAFFKYINSLLTFLSEEFVITQAGVLKQEMGVILPLAISFYTFQIIAFVVDYWRGEIKELKLVDFVVFIMFFPQLIAGPIMRHHEFLGKMNKPEWNPEDTPKGIFLIGFGLVKKVLVADRIAFIINPVWSDPDHYNGISILAAMIGFIAQVYCDFSGYTDIARGAARLLGYKIPENFFAPYLATTFTDLWRRWHVTLATWLRDYLYIPLGGSRGSATRVYVNLMIVMCLGGLWHGDTYNFFFWGFWSGLFLIGEKLLGLDKGLKTIPGKIVGNFVVMIAWTIGATFFRAPDLTIVYKMFMGLFFMGRETLGSIGTIWQLFFITLALQALRQYSKHYAGWFLQRWKVLTPIGVSVLFFLIARIENHAEEFIYFRF